MLLGDVGGPMQELKVPRMTSIDDCVVTHYDTFSAWAPRTPSTCVFMENHGKICKVRRFEDKTNLKACASLYIFISCGRLLMVGSSI